MAEKKAVRKVEIWVATAPFVFGKDEYEPGDEWAVPAGYEFNQAQTTLNQGRPTFTRVEKKGAGEKQWENITHEILPVARPDEGASA